MFVFSTVTKQGVLEGDVDTLANERFKGLKHFDIGVSAVVSYTSNMDTPQKHISYSFYVWIR